jgi:hypothetical protein
MLKCFTSFNHVNYLLNSRIDIEEVLHFNELVSFLAGNAGFTWVKSAHTSWQKTALV